MNAAGETVGADAFAGGVGDGAPAEGAVARAGAVIGSDADGVVYAAAVRAIGVDAEVLAGRTKVEEMDADDVACIVVGRLGASAGTVRCVAVDAAAGVDVVDVGAAA